MSRTPSRAERAAMAATQPAATPPPPVSRADRFLAAIGAHPTPAQAAQAKPLAQLATDYRAACDAARCLLALGVDGWAVYDHKQARENQWLNDHAHGNGKALPWRPRMDRHWDFIARLDEDLESGPDGGGYRPAWLARRINAAVSAFDGAWDAVCWRVSACLKAGLTKALVYEYIFDTHARWIAEHDDDSHAVPWYWTTPRRLT